MALQPGLIPATAAMVPKSPTQASELKMPEGHDLWTRGGRWRRLESGFTPLPCGRRTRSEAASPLSVPLVLTSES